MKLFKWIHGRQGTGYDKMCMLYNKYIVPFDLYILKFPKNSYIPPHKDEVKGKRHYRINIIIKHAKCGGIFEIEKSIIDVKYFKLFRPDKYYHSVSEILDGNRVVLSFGLCI